MIGGNDGSSFLNSCEVYDPVSNKWSFAASMNRQRAGVGADVLDGLLYVSGIESSSYDRSYFPVVFQLHCRFSYMRKCTNSCSSCLW